MAATNHKMVTNRARGTVRSLFIRMSLRPGQEIAEYPKKLLDLREDCIHGTQTDSGPPFKITISHIWKHRKSHGCNWSLSDCADTEGMFPAPDLGQDLT